MVLSPETWASFSSSRRVGTLIGLFTTVPQCLEQCLAPSKSQQTLDEFFIPPVTLHPIKHQALLMLTPE